MVSLDDKSALLIYRVGPVYCCSPTSCIETVTIPCSLTHPPGSGAAQPGILRHGGHIVSVAELRFLFGVTESPWQQPGRLVITRLKDGYIGFWVDEIIDVIQFPEKGWGNLPPHIPRGIFTRTLLFKEHIHLYTDFEKLQTLTEAGYLKHYIARLEEQHTASRKKDKPTAKAVEPETKTPPATPAAKPTPQAGCQASVKNKIPPLTNTSNEAAAAPLKTMPPTQSTTKINTSAKTHQPNVTSLADNKRTVSKKTGVSTGTPKIEKPKATEAKPASPVRPTPEKRIKTIPSSQPIQTSTESSGLPGLMIFILLVASLGYGAYQFLIDSPGKSKLASNASTEALPLVKAPPSYSTSTLNNDSLQVESNNEPSTDVAISPSQNNSHEISSGRKQQYLASIEKDDDGITIILNAPTTKTTVINQDNKIEEAAASANSATNTKQSEFIAHQPGSTTAVIQQTDTRQAEKLEFTHIVVKGDTLWDIAQRYVENPYLYPKLARLSNIKNPHRIYPGNKVRIIRYLH